MKPRLRAATLGVLLVCAVTTACVNDGGATPAVTPPTVNFVGNATCSTRSQQPYQPSPPNTNGAPVGTAVDEMPHVHVKVGTQVEYNHDPPTSGCHYNVGGVAPVPPGVYSEVLPPEYWVHNLEHGYVVVLFNCPNQSCPADYQTLLTWQRGLRGDGNFPYAKVVVVGESTMKDRFAVVSWDWYLGLGNTLDMTKVQAFYDNHKDQAPEGAMSS